MNKQSITVIVTVLVVVVLLYFFGHREGRAPAEQAPYATSATTTEPRVAIDLYPLYADVEWNKAETEKVTIGTTTYSGVSVTSATVDADTNPAAIFTPFTDYYDTLLRGRGWHIANNLAAGGHTGGQIGYQNGPGTILVRYTITYEKKPENAPSECPCDVSFSLFSSGATD